MVLRRDTAPLAGFEGIYDRMLNEIVPRMRRMVIDKTEISCLKAVVLLNPGKITKMLRGVCEICTTVDLARVCCVADMKGVQAAGEIETLREKIYGGMEDYCKAHYPEDPTRFAKLLLRMPATRSIALKVPYLILQGDKAAFNSMLTELLESAQTGNQFD